MFWIVSWKGDKFPKMELNQNMSLGGKSCQTKVSNVAIAHIKRMYTSADLVPENI